MITRFDLFVVLRNQVSDRRMVRRSLAIEAVMEELAAAIGEDHKIWGLAGLAADIDCMMARENPGRRGEIAEELLATEGAPPEVAAAARERWQLAPEDMTRIAAGIVIAARLVDEIFADAEDLEAGGLDKVEAGGMAHRLRRAAEKRGEEAAIRALRCLARLDLPLERAAELACAGVRRVREDLRL